MWGPAVSLVTRAANECGAELRPGSPPQGAVDFRAPWRVPGEPSGSMWTTGRCKDSGTPSVRTAPSSVCRGPGWTAPSSVCRGPGWTAPSSVCRGPGWTAPSSVCLVLGGRHPAVCAVVLGGQHPAVCAGVLGGQHPAVCAVVLGVLWSWVAMLAALPRFPSWSCENLQS